MTPTGRRRLHSWSRAVRRLADALEVPRDAPLALDGTIQRFEFAFELAWKVLKDALEDEGLDVKTPREALREAYRVGWLADEGVWLTMLRDRNLSSHTYDEDLAADLYQRLPAAHAALADALDTITALDA